MTSATAPARSLHSKLAEVMAEVGRIPKNGKAAPSMGGYAFVQVGDAADAIRGLLAIRKVSMLPTSVEITGEAEHETKSGGTMTTQTVRTTWTLTDGESGESITIQSLGTGADTGDKFSPKAQTNAMKYALLMGFLLSTGDDPELGKNSDDRRPHRERFLSDRDAPTADPTTAFDAGLVGVAEQGKGDADFELRQTPTGHVLVFRLSAKAGSRAGTKVIVRDVLAELVTEYRAGIEGQRVTCWGSVTPESFTPAGAKKPVEYTVLNLSRLKVGALDLSAPDHEPSEDEDATLDDLTLLEFPDKLPTTA